MRVITGSARGVRLDTLSGDSVRPTTDRVKEAIFSILHFEIEGRNVLDLFAGSGQLGIEAISRGAKKVWFVDKSNESLDIVKKNLTKTKLEKESVVFRSDYSDFLIGTKQTFDIAFLDPPYSAGLLIDALEKLTPKMSDFGIIVCEHPVGTEIPSAINDFFMHRTYKYGNILVSVYKKHNSEATINE